MAIYKIWHPASHEIFARYIETEMTANQVADIAAGLQFFIEDETEYGDCSTVDENAILTFLCTYFGCKPASADAWLTAAREHYLSMKPDTPNQADEALNDTVYGFGIDLFSERENRCGTGNEQYIGMILPYRNTPFIEALTKHFNDESCLYSFKPFEFIAQDDE